MKVKIELKEDQADLMFTLLDWFEQEWEYYWRDWIPSLNAICRKVEKAREAKCTRN